MDPRTQRVMRVWVHPPTTSDTTKPMPDYDIHLDDKFGSLELIDSPGEIAAHEPWFNQTLTTVNDSVVRLGIIESDFHWHKHDVEDEFFLVLEGQLLIDLEESRDGDAEPASGLHGPARRHPPHARADEDGDPDGRAGPESRPTGD